MQKSQTSDFTQEIHTQGFAIAPQVINPAAVQNLIKAVEQIPSSEAISQRGGQAFGIRNLLNVMPAARALAEEPALRSLVEPILGIKARVVRSIFFDKSPTANWKVPWHQDVTIAVQSKIPTPGYQCWSTKAGISHVQPPVAVLENILILRLHLDETSEQNGALKVIPSSHCQGRLSDQQIQEWQDKGEKITCQVSSGGALLMRPLLLHASSQSTTSDHRRVIHLEWAGMELPNGLQWFGS
jgi:ectoine hydroxylase-related dioxygenase (phytanoyl-CoA dioxygenase family)